MEDEKEVAYEYSPTLHLAINSFLNNASSMSMTLVCPFSMSMTYLLE